jgi:hypothetical protein
MIGNGVPQVRKKSGRLDQAWRKAEIEQRSDLRGECNRAVPTREE